MLQLLKYMTYFLILIMVNCSSNNLNDNILLPSNKNNKNSLDDPEIHEALSEFIHGSNILSKRIKDYASSQETDHNAVLQMVREHMNDREGIRNAVNRISRDLHLHKNNTERTEHMLHRARKEVDRLFHAIDDRLYKTGGLPNVVKHHKNKNHTNNNKWYDAVSHTMNKTRLADLDSITQAANSVKRFFDIVKLKGQKKPKQKYYSDTFAEDDDDDDEEEEDEEEE